MTKKKIIGTIFVLPFSLLFIALLLRVAKQDLAALSTIGVFALVSAFAVIGLSLLTFKS